MITSFLYTDGLGVHEGRLVDDRLKAIEFIYHDSPLFKYGEKKALTANDTGKAPY